LRKAYLKTLTKTKNFGKALHHLLKAFYDNDLSTPSKDSYTELIELFDALDWKIWKNHFMAKMIQECPTL
jgi:succinate dehydrogenase flavin-adding protein (antitoxin of CptAB toxin-antitoxin module)